MASDSVDAKKKKQEQEEVAKAGNANRNPKRDSSGKRIPAAQRQARAAQNTGGQTGANNPVKGGSNNYSKDSAPAVGSDKKDKHGHKIKNMTEAEIMAQPLHDYDGGRLVADCKRARSMGSKLGWGCKLLLSRLQQEENHPYRGDKGSPGNKAAPFSDLDMEFNKGRFIVDGCKDKEGMKRAQEMYGNEMTHSEKYAADMEIKNFHRGEGTDPYGYAHEVRAANCGGRRCKGCRYVQAPMFDTAKMKEQQVKQLLTEFFQDPKAFMQRHPESAMETIVIKSILKEEDDEAMAMENAQELTASVSRIDDEPVTFEDIVKTRQIIKCNSAKVEEEAKEEPEAEKQ